MVFATKNMFLNHSIITLKTFDMAQLDMYNIKTE